MKTKLSSADFPKQLEGFAGGMGFKSIASITESDLGFDMSLDIKGYISEPVDGVYYAEVRDRNGNSEFARGKIDEMQKWLTDTVCEFCNKTL